MKEYENSCDIMRIYTRELGCYSVKYSEEDVSRRG